MPVLRSKPQSIEPVAESPVRLLPDCSVDEAHLPRVLFTGASRLMALDRAWPLSAMVLLSISLFYVSSVLFALNIFHGNFSGFVRFAAFRTQSLPYLKEHPALDDSLMKRPSGYDGQFYFYIALDPFLLHFKDQPRAHHRAVDSPRYRYGRIVFPLLIKLFSFDRPELYSTTMICLILASLSAGAFFLLRIAVFFKRSPLWALLYVLIPGFMASLHSALPEPIAAAFLLGGTYFYLRKHTMLAMVFFQLSILTRETAMIFVAILIALECFQEKRVRQSLLLSCSILPYLAWKGYVTWRLFPEFRWTTLLFGPRDFAAPFAGIADLYIAHWNGTPFQNGLWLFAILITCNLLIGILLTIRRRNPFSVALLSYSILHVCLNYRMLWSGIRSMERTTYEGFLFLAIAFLAGPGGVRRWPQRAILLLFAVVAVYDSLLSSQAEAYCAGFNLLRPILYAVRCGGWS